MHGVRGRAPPQGCIVRSLTLHFCLRLFPRLEPVSSWSHDNNFTRGWPMIWPRDSLTDTEMLCLYSVATRLRPALQLCLMPYLQSIVILQSSDFGCRVCPS
ncbi:hypothetical protein P3S67_030973 [Capsicum chacoense]